MKHNLYRMNHKLYVWFKLNNTLVEIRDFNFLILK